MSDRQKAVLIILALVVLVPAAIALNGWVFTVLWAWFVVPMGAPVLGVWHALGIGLVVHMPLRGLAAKSDITSTKPAADRLTDAAATTFGTPLLTLALGWFFRAMML